MARVGALPAALAALLVWAIEKQPRGARSGTCTEWYPSLVMEEGGAAIARKSHLSGDGPFGGRRARARARGERRWGRDPSKLNTILGHSGEGRFVCNGERGRRDPPHTYHSVEG
eukprot:8947499-Pyramimonas_sp.AAC.1